MRVSEASGLTVADVDLDAGLIAVRTQKNPGRVGLVTKSTKGRRSRVVPIVDPLRPTLERLVHGRSPTDRLLVGPRGGVITTATLRDATKWDQLVSPLGYPGLVRPGLRHAAPAWMADSGVPPHVLQRVTGHQHHAETVRYMHPIPNAVRHIPNAVRHAGGAFSKWWGLDGDFSSRGEGAPKLRSGHDKRPRPA